MQIAYYYRNPVLETAEGRAQHEQICTLLSRLRTAGRIGAFVIKDADCAFAMGEARQQFFDRLRIFAMRHKAGLARVFGSRRAGFWYLPQQFLLVSEADELREVFPCRMGDGEDVEPLEFLERLDRGQFWTRRSGAGMEGKKHKALIAEILAQPDALEPGLKLCGQNIQVSRDFGDLGFIDLVFEDRDGRTLLVEVKAGPGELDKAVGQIMRHRHLFAQQNRVEETSIRIGIACPLIPALNRSVCEGAGITCFEVSKTATAETRCK